MIDEPHTDYFHTGVGEEEYSFIMNCWKVPYDSTFIGFIALENNFNVQPTWS